MPSSVPDKRDTPTRPRLRDVILHLTGVINGITVGWLLWEKL